MSDTDDNVIPFWDTISPSAAKETKGISSYLAFQTQDRLTGFVLYTRAMRTTFYYSHLLNVTLEEPDLNKLYLTTTTAFITIYGQNLEPLADALTMQVVKSIHEFSKTKYTAPPPDDGKPFIDKIEVEILKPSPPKPSRERVAHQTEKDGVN